MPLSPFRRRHPRPDPRAELLDGVAAIARAAVDVQVIANVAAEYERRSVVGDHTSIEATMRRQRARSRALLDAAADRARIDVDELLTAGGPYAHHAWDSPVWTGPYEPPSTVARVVRVGSLHFRAPVAALSLPFVLPVLGTTLAVTYDQAGPAVAHHLAQGFVTRALAASRPGAVRVHVMDCGGAGHHLGILEQLPEPLAAPTHHTYDGICEQLHHLSTSRDETHPIVLVANVGAAVPAEVWRQLSVLTTTVTHTAACVVVVATGHEHAADSPLLGPRANGEHLHVDDSGTTAWRTAPPTLTDPPIHDISAPRDRQRSFLTEVVAPAAHRSRFQGRS